MGGHNMPVQSIRGNSELAKLIKQRRNDLQLTIEEAATIAGVGTKTWARYEAGGSIRRDKIKGICKALKWHSFPSPGEQTDQTNEKLDIHELKNHKAWSIFLEKRFGEYAAASFVIGSDILIDHLSEDIEKISSMPRGSHVGQIDFSWIKDILPRQFLTRYDYEFLYSLYCTAKRFQDLVSASKESPIMAHSVLEELTLYFIVEESRLLLEEETLLSELPDDWDNWVFDLFDDMDIITWLYSDFSISTDNPYHFDLWFENRFLMH